MTLWLCLVNTACAILSVFTSTHFVSCTIQCEETGFYLLSALVFEEAVCAVSHGFYVTQVCRRASLAVKSFALVINLFAVVLLFISPLNETELARPKTAQRAEGVKDVVSSLVKKKIILAMTKIYLHMIL